jgi:hypothetical protein
MYLDITSIYGIFSKVTVTNMVLMQNLEILSTTFDVCKDCVLKE